MPCVCPTLPPAFCFFFFPTPLEPRFTVFNDIKIVCFPLPPSTKRNEKEIFVDRVKRFAFFHFLFSSSSVFYSLSFFKEIPERIWTTEWKVFDNPASFQFFILIFHNCFNNITIFPNFFHSSLEKKIQKKISRRRSSSLAPSLSLFLNQLQVILSICLNVASSFH